MKGHRAAKPPNVLVQNKRLILALVVLVAFVLVWLAFMPVHVHLTIEPDTPENHVDQATLTIEKEPTTGATDTKEQTATTPSAAATATDIPKTPQHSAPDIPTPPTDEPAKTDKLAPVDLTPPVVPAQPTPPPASLGRNDATLISTEQLDLVDSELVCARPNDQPAECDWAWGPPTSRSPNSEVGHVRDELDPKSDWNKPQDFYTYQAGIMTTGEGPGVLVRIRMKDLCCRSPVPLPLSYFSVSAHGAAQAAANPPLALGKEPAALGRGHLKVVQSQTGWGRDSDLTNLVDEERVLQTFVLLPDPGHYEIRVSLSLYNVSLDMISENYECRSKAYNDRSGMWINGPLKNAHDEVGTHLFISPRASAKSRAYTDVRPLCGTEGNDRLGGASFTGTPFGMPLAGRWVYQPQPGEDRLTDRTKLLTRKELVEGSLWEPYFCALDRHVPYPLVLEDLRWMHFTGDSNTRHMFFYVCELGNGTLLTSNPDKVLRRMDPPFTCVGPSSPDNRPDDATKLVPGSASRWVATYTSWFWPKRQTLQEADFTFGVQCPRYDEVEGNVDGLFYGWPHCDSVPSWVHSLPGPGATYFGWGSHAAEMGANPATGKYLGGEEVLGLAYFKKHPAIFPLTTANSPELIPDKFGRQHVMRNNERVHGSNLHLQAEIFRAHFDFASRTPNGGGRAADNFIPVFDIFSPTHAAHSDLAVDAVHFDKHFSYEEPRWLMHYLHYGRNFGAPVAPPPAATAAAADGRRVEVESASQPEPKLA